MMQDKRHAIVIGVNHYYRCKDLNYCENDAEKVAEIFSQELDIEPNNITLLTSSSKDERYKPLKLNILHAVAELQRKMSIHEVESIFFYFAGHGYRENGRGGDYLLPQDGTLNSLQESGLAIVDLCKLLGSLNTHQVVFFLDACRGELVSGRSATQSFAFGEEASEAARSYGVVIFFSCSPGELSLESSKLGHGVFTYSLLEGLSSRKVRTVNELNRYLKNKVPNICKEAGVQSFVPYTSVAPLENSNLVICPRGSSISKEDLPDIKNNFIIVGPSNSGKTTIGKSLASYTGNQHVELSDYVWSHYNAAKETGSVLDFVDNIWKINTKTFFADKLIKEHEKNKLGSLVICGPRCREEIIRLKQYFGNSIVIGIEADMSKRFERLGMRKRDRYAMTMEEFLKKDYREYSWGMSHALYQLTDFLIVNNGSLEELNDTLFERCRVRGLLKNSEEEQSPKTISGENKILEYNA